MFQTLYNLTFLYDLLHILACQKIFISLLLQFVQGSAHICHRLPGLHLLCPNHTVTLRFHDKSYNMQHS